jgi:TolB-like protein/Tfp pilus assembly protein PilF
VRLGSSSLIPVEAKAIRPQATFYNFGSFRLYAADRRLLRDGVPVQLAPKVFDTLVVLVENAGRLVGKEELLARLWPDTFVEEATLARNVSDLRKSLGESSGDRRYIETVPKSGYRFVSSVTQCSDDDTVIVTRSHTRSHIVVEEQTEPGVDFRSIAVLPFKPLSVNDADEYLGLGIADALITRLSNLPTITVRPTTAVMKYSGGREDPAAAGRDLRVEAVLDGAIQRSGERIRVTVQLVSVSRGAPLWADRFDEMFTDIFEVEDSISEQVASALALRLTGDERRLLNKRYTRNSEAYELYLRGRYHWNKRTEDGLEKSIECFLEAIAIDPGFALAHAGLADSYTLLGDVGLSAVRPIEAFTRGKLSAIKALEIDNALAEACTSLGHIHMHCYEWTEARDEFERAVSLNPRYPHARQLRAFYFAFQDRIGDAIVEIEKALRLDPLSLPINMDLGVINYFAREYDKAIEQYHKTIDLDANFERAHFWLAGACEQKKMYDDAISEYQMALKLSGGSLEARASLGHAYAKAARRDDALCVLQELHREAGRKYVSPYDLAIIHLGVDDVDGAIAWLRKACDDHAGWMIYLSVDPRLDPIRADHRFQELLRRVGFRH